MACDGTRVFVLGGLLPPGPQAGETKLIHVLNTSMYCFFIISFGLSSSLKQSSSFWNLTPTLSSIVGRPHNLRRSHPRAECRVNHDSRASLRRTWISTQDVILLPSKKLPPENQTTPPLYRLLAIEPPVRMASHRYSRI